MANSTVLFASVATIILTASSAAVADNVTPEADFQSEAQQTATSVKAVVVDWYSASIDPRGGVTFIAVLCRNDDPDDQEGFYLIRSGERRWMLAGTISPPWKQSGLPVNVRINDHGYCGDGPRSSPPPWRMTHDPFLFNHGLTSDSWTIAELAIRDGELKVARRQEIRWSPTLVRYYDQDFDQLQFEERYVRHRRTTTRSGRLLPIEDPMKDPDPGSPRILDTLRPGLSKKKELQLSISRSTIDRWLKFVLPTSDNVALSIGFCDISKGGSFGGECLCRVRCSMKRDGWRLQHSNCPSVVVAAKGQDLTMVFGSKPEETDEWPVTARLEHRRGGTVLQSLTSGGDWGVGSGGLDLFIANDGGGRYPNVDDAWLASLELQPLPAK